MKTHNDPECYCEECCATASEWWQWSNPEGDNKSGSRYWTAEHAEADRELAALDGLTELEHVRGGRHEKQR